MKTNFNGGFGNDTIGQVYRGQMDGSLAMRSATTVATRAAR